MIRIGIIGLGEMGFNHTRVFSNQEEVEIVSICDINKSQLEKTQRIFRIGKTYTDYKLMIANENLDAVVIAVPTSKHEQVAIDCINERIHILLEKPIADTLENADRIIAAANKNKVKLLIGHIERFNPAISKLKAFLDENFLGGIYLINTIRVGPYPKRLRDVGVLVDLAVHDLDIIQHLASDIKQIFSNVMFAEKRPIYSKVLFKLKNEVTGSSEFSWVSPKRERRMVIFGAKGVLEADYQHQTLIFYENGENFGETLESKSLEYHQSILLAGNISEGRVIQYPIKKQEPLLLEIRHFIDCIINDKEPNISPLEARKALFLALKVLESGTKNEVVFI